MLRVTLELIPHGNEKLKATVGTLEISNDRSGDWTFGNYDFHMDYLMHTEEGVPVDAAIKNQLRCIGQMKNFKRSGGYWETVKQVLSHIETNLDKIKSK